MILIIFIIKEMNINLFYQILNKIKKHSYLFY
jgi:hypothetical protein